MAKPRIKIDWAEFDKLCFLQCTQEEIAWWFDCSVDTIDRACKREQKRPFAEIFKQKGGKGRISLRRKQYELALQGNVTLLIWLGKQYLGQTDKVEQQEFVKSESTITWKTKWGSTGEPTPNQESDTD